MSGTRKTTAAEEPSEPLSEQDGEGDKMVIRVRRGALRRFDQLKAKSAELPVDIKWDRRVADRRSATAAPEGERRNAERRQAPPYTWDVADFLLVGDTSSPSEPDRDATGSPRKKRPR